MRNKLMINKGFTLVELLIVVIILAILAGIVVPQFASSTDDAKSSAVDSTLANIRASIDFYYQQHGSYPGSSTAAPTAACVGTAGTGIATSGAGTTAEDAFLSQLTLYTDTNGGACSTKDANHKYGPYLKKRPLSTDPFTGTVSTIVVVGLGDLDLVADTPAPGPGGYKYDSGSGKFIINLGAEENR